MSCRALALTSCALLPLLATFAHAGVATRSFPLVGPDEGMRPALAELEQLAGLSAVRLTDVNLPGGAVALELERVLISTAGAVVAVDGQPLDGAPDAGVSLWSGHVVGEPGSDVFLAFSASGSRGWVRRAGSLVHLLAAPDADGRWAGTTSRWMSDPELVASDAQGGGRRPARRRPPRSPRCRVPSVPRPPPRPPPTAARCRCSRRA